MGKIKHAKPEEFYLQQIRELEKQVRRLRQRIKQLERSPNKHLGSEFKSILKEEQIKIPKLCENCGKGKIKEIEVVGRIFDTCELCDWRSKARKAKRRRG